MEPTHVHLLINHYPIFATFIGFAILLFGLIKNNQTARVIAYVIFVSAAFVSFLAFQSGEGAEDIIEKLLPELEKYIEAHEEAAEIALWFAIGLGLLSAIAIYTTIKQKLIEKKIGLTILVASVISIAFFAYVGSLGGKIVHAELRGNSTITNTIE